MKEKLKKVGNCIKDHKKEIAIGTVVAIGSVFVGKFAWDRGRVMYNEWIEHEAMGNKIIESLGGYTQHDMKFDVGYSEGYSSKGDRIGTTFNDLHVGDLGKVGTELLRIPGITEESTISAIIHNENL